MSQLKKSTCPICGEPTQIICDALRGGRPGPVHYCDGCDSAHLDQAAINRDEQQFYNETYMTEIKKEGAGPTPLALERFRQEQVRPHLSGKERILDIGAGDGRFLELVRPYVAELMASEFNISKAAEIERRLGIHCHTGLLEDIDASKKFDCISMFQLFEHIAEPHAFMESISNILSENGLIFLDAPNFKDPLFSLYKITKLTSGFFPEQHPLLYSPKGLEKIMDMSGFDKVQVTTIQTYSITNHLNWIYQGKGNNSFRKECP